MLYWMCTKALAIKCGTQTISVKSKQINRTNGTTKCKGLKPIAAAASVSRDKRQDLFQLKVLKCVPTIPQRITENMAIWATSKYVCAYIGCVCVCVYGCAVACLLKGPIRMPFARRVSSVCLSRPKCNWCKSIYWKKIEIHTNPCQMGFLLKSIKLTNGGKQSYDCPYELLTQQNILFSPHI